MSIADSLIKRILSEQKLQTRDSDPALPDAAPQDDLLSPEIFQDAPNLEDFQERAPDSGHEFPENPDARSVLGTYRHMASPGLITLYGRNIEAYWKSLLRHAHRQFPFITSKDGERALSLVVHLVYQHERFHYICDFSRQLLGGQFDRWHEEGLAVAHEWHWLKGLGWNSFAGLMHPTLKRLLIHAMFDHRAPGYRDWRHYAYLPDFQVAVTAYAGAHSGSKLNGTDFSLGAWLIAHGADDANRGWEETVVY